MENIGSDKGISWNCVLLIWSRLSAWVPIFFCLISNIVMPKLKEWHSYYLSLIFKVDLVLHNVLTSIEFQSSIHHPL